MADVVDNLKKAFKDVRLCKSRGGSVSGNSRVLAQVAEDIFLLSRQDAHFLLPKILQWLCERHADGTLLEREPALTVLLFVNMATGYTDEDYEMDQQIAGKRAAKYAKKSALYLKKQAEGLFGGFSANQAAAIVDWLEHAKSWKPYQAHQGNITTAQRYWRSIADRRRRELADNPTRKD